MKRLKTLILPVIAALTSVLIISCGGAPPSGPGPSNTWTPNFTATITMTFSTIVPTLTPSLTRTTTPCSLCPDAYEPDNVYTQAKQIAAGTPQPRTFHVWDDEDWVTFTLQYESEIDLSISGYPTDGGGDDCPYLEAYTDPAGSSFFSFGYTTDSIHYNFVQPGTYYLKIRHANYDLDGSYSLSFSVNPYPTATPEDTITLTETISGTSTPEPTASPTFTATPTLTPWPTDVYEPDNPSASAAVFTPGPQLNHTLFPAGDEDWYKFTLTSPADVSVSAAAAPLGWDMHMDLFYDYNLSNPILTANGNFPDGLCWFIRHLDAGTYYVRVYDADTSSPLGYDMNYNRVYSTFTASPTATTTHTNSPTGTPTCFPDAYEPDDLPTQATTMTPGVTQYHSNYPANDVDYLKFQVDYPSLFTVHVEGNPYSTHNIMVSTDNAGVPGTGISGCSGCYGNVDVTGEAWIGTHWITLSSAYTYYQYSVSLSLVAMTPSPTFTQTQTHTASPTSTNSPTVTPTLAAWTSHAFGSLANCTNPALAASGGAPSYGHVRFGSLYVNDTLRVNNTDSAKLGQKWLAQSASYTYVTYPDNSDGFIKLLSSANWTLPSNTGAKGSQPCIFLDGDTPYIAYADSDAGNSICVRTYAGSWSYCGTANFTTPASLGTYNSLAISGYNDGTLKLYVAYVDSSNGNKVRVMWKDGAAAWAQLGSGPATSESSSNVDISAVDSSNVFLMYSGAGIVPNVLKWNGANWSDLSMPYASQGRYNSISASGYNEIYASYYNLTTTKITVRKYNGTGWQPLNNTTGYTEAGVSFNSILKSAGTVYSGYISSTGIMSVYKYE